MRLVKHISLFQRLGKQSLSSLQHWDNAKSTLAERQLLQLKEHAISQRSHTNKVVLGRKSMMRLTLEQSRTRFLRLFSQDDIQIISLELEEGKKCEGNSHKIGTARLTSRWRMTMTTQIITLAFIDHFWGQICFSAVPMRLYQLRSRTSSWPLSISLAPFAPVMGR